MSDQVVLIPLMAVVFRSFEDGFPEAVQVWLDATMPGRWYWLDEGDHLYRFEERNGVRDDESYAYPIVFEHASDLALFKLTWGGAQ